jgi:hypothetical protein
MSTIASKAPLLQIDALHQQHSRLAKLPLKKCSQVLFNLDQLSLQCETPLQNNQTFLVRPYSECTTQLKQTTNLLETHKTMGRHSKVQKNQ